MKDEQACAGRLVRAWRRCSRSAIRNGRVRESKFVRFAAIERRYRRTGANRDAFGSHVLRLPFQPDPMALVQPSGPDFMARRTRRGVGTKGTQLLRVGLVLSANAKAKAPVDGPGAARALDAAVGLSPDASGRAAH